MSGMIFSHIFALTRVLRYDNSASLPLIRSGLAGNRRWLRHPRQFQLKEEIVVLCENRDRNDDDSNDVFLSKTLVSHIYTTFRNKIES